MSYDDCFTKQAAAYARFRPRYPKELIQYFASIADQRELAWDCGTGNGQVALSLADYFDSVVATDVNASQIGHSFRHPRISYVIGRAEQSGLRAESVNLITVGNALHWFDLEHFYQEAMRVLRPRGVVAVFQYGFQKLGHAFDDIILPFETEFLKEYWTDRNRLAMSGYATLPFPFRRVSAPAFELKLLWRFDDLRGFVSSWSAVQKFKDKHGKDPFDEIRGDLLGLWGDPQTEREIRWDLELHVGQHAT